MTGDLADSFALSLSQAPDRTLAPDCRRVPPDLIRRAREDLAVIAELTAILDPEEGEPAPRPDELGATRWCRWCGLADPPGGLRDGSPPITRAMELEPGPQGGIPRPVPGQLQAPAADVETAPGDVPCRDEEYCHRVPRRPLWRHAEEQQRRAHSRALRYEQDRARWEAEGLERPRAERRVPGAPVRPVPLPQRLASEAERPVDPQMSSNSGLLAGKLEHHPDVVRLIVAGAPMTAVNAKVRELRAERHAQRAARAERSWAGALAHSAARHVGHVQRPLC